MIKTKKLARDVNMYTHQKQDALYLRMYLRHLKIHVCAWIKIESRRMKNGRRGHREKTKAVREKTVTLVMRPCAEFVIGYFNQIIIIVCFLSKDTRNDIKMIVALQNISPQHQGIKLIQFETGCWRVDVVKIAVE